MTDDDKKSFAIFAEQLSLCTYKYNRDVLKRGGQWGIPPRSLKSMVGGYQASTSDLSPLQRKKKKE